MKLTVLGSGTSVPDAQRGPAGLLLEHEDQHWLIDGGSGTLQRCAVAGFDPRRLTGGIYTHRHPDHTADLVPLLFSMRVGPPRRDRPYPIVAGEGFGAFLAGLRGVYGKWLDFPGGTPLTEMPLDGPGRHPLAPGLTLQTLPAAHSAGAVHLRFQTAHAAVVFSGDTGPSENLTELARGADLLVCECAGSDTEPIPGHLTPSDVACIVRQARPAEVWLTHLYPQVNPQTAVATVTATGTPTRRVRDLESWESSMPFVEQTTDP